MASGLSKVLLAKAHPRPFALVPGVSHRLSTVPSLSSMKDLINGLSVCFLIDAGPIALRNRSLDHGGAPDVLEMHLVSVFVPSTCNGHVV